MILGAVSAATACIWASPAIQPGPQVVTFSSDVDGSDQPYALYVPRNFDPAKRYPLVVSLHGAWSNHRLNLRRVFGMGNRPGESYVLFKGGLDNIVAEGRFDRDWRVPPADAVKITATGAARR